ncbi:reverse transcriptase domain-containing protein [Tanacetum coccineum]
MMKTINQRMSVKEIERVVAQRVANAIEAIASYETKTNMARKLTIQTERQEDKVAKNASNKRKWEGNHNGSPSQQNKGHKVPRAHITWPINKKAYAGSLPLTPAAAEYQRTLTCYECGGLGHYKRDCPELKNQNHGNQAGSMEARGVVHAFGGGETKQDLNNIEDEIEA